MSSAPRKERDRPFQFSLLALLVTVSITCFVVAQPVVAMLGSAAVACLVLGIVCVRGALKSRNPGYISGLAFGTIFVVFGTVACVASIVIGWRR